MLPIYIIGNWHQKNRKGFELIKEMPVQSWRGEKDGILFINHLDINIINEHNRVIVGPGIDFKQGIDFFKSYSGEKPILFNTLSPWNKYLHDTYAPNPRITYITLPFPVDVEKFHPTEKKKRFFIYYKHVHSSRLHHILTYLQNSTLLQEYEYKLFTYGSYQEKEYMDYLPSSQFGIWIGSHESQGFALEEALSCNCPLFVYNVTSMKNECFHDTTYPWIHVEEALPATTASYFDETCGMLYDLTDSLEDKLTTFINRIAEYRPREFVIKHLTSTSFIEKITALFPKCKELIPIVSVNIMGGLGNQLFQIAAAYAYAKKEGGVLQIVHKLDNGNRPVYWDSLLEKVKPYLVQTIPSLTHWHELNPTMYSEIPPLPTNGIYLNGYLQTSKYWYNDTIKQEIKELFHPSQSFTISKQYKYVLEHKERVIVIHARRTDYLKASAIHGPLTSTYYKEAVRKMVSRVRNPIFLLCSDDPSYWKEIKHDIHIVFDYEHIILKNESDIHTFVLLQQFQHYIISNSTFIWWSVWLSEAKNVIAPAKWFGPEGPFPYHDIYEEAWERI